jgi:hypothetical protein
MDGGLFYIFPQRWPPEMTVRFLGDWPLKKYFLRNAQCVQGCAYTSSFTLLSLSLFR